MPRPIVSLIAAVAKNGGIGRNNSLLTRLPQDLQRFKRTTLGSTVVMGRKTWDSIGRALPERRNIVITHDPEWRGEAALGAPSWPAAMKLAADAEKLFVIGGAQIYALALPFADELELTEIDAEFPADTFFPDWNRASFEQVSRELHETAEGLRYSFTTYGKVGRGV